MSYQIKLEKFEGPFDLLLFFIKRDELDIYDIPISKVLTDFLDYIHQMEIINIEVASEFILMASTLMRIKSKMLLPRPELNEEGEEIDPREDLVKHVLLYKKYKSTVPILSAFEDNYIGRHHRGSLVNEMKHLAKMNNVDYEMEHLSLFKIMSVYKKLLKRQALKMENPVHQVIPFPYTVEQQKERIFELLVTKERVSFNDIIATSKEKIVLIFNFLAVLELLQLRTIRITIGEGYNNFWISKREEG